MGHERTPLIRRCVVRINCQTCHRRTPNSLPTPIGPARTVHRSLKRCRLPFCLRQILSAIPGRRSPHFCATIPSARPRAASLQSLRLEKCASREPELWILPGFGNRQSTSPKPIRSPDLNFVQHPDNPVLIATARRDCLSVKSRLAMRALAESLSTNHPFHILRERIWPLQVLRWTQRKGTRGSNT